MDLTLKKKSKLTPKEWIRTYPKRLTENLHQIMDQNKPKDQMKKHFMTGLSSWYLNATACL